MSCGYNKFHQERTKFDIDMNNKWDVWNKPIATTPIKEGFRNRENYAQRKVEKIGNQVISLQDPDNLASYSAFFI